MATNFFFDQRENQAEQKLLADLIEEAIQIHGNDVLYIPRQMNNFDDLYDTDDQSSYSDSYEIEMYIKSVRGFGGMKDFLNQFGGNIQDEVEWSVSKRVFETLIGAKTGFSRPREGDLIYFPQNRKCFKITFVDSREMFYQLGDLYTYDLRTELFTYSGERFDTGIEDLDRINAVSTNVVDWAILTEDGKLLTTEDGNIIVSEGYDLEKIAPGSQNKFLQDQFDSFVDWSEMDPFSDGNA